MAQINACDLADARSCTNAKKDMQLCIHAILPFYPCLVMWLLADMTENGETNEINCVYISSSVFFLAISRQRKQIVF